MWVRRSARGKRCSRRYLTNMQRLLLTRSAHAHTRHSLRPILCRFAHSKASDVRVGHLINYDNKLQSVLSTTRREMGRGHTTYLVEVISIGGSSAKKQYVKLNAGDDVDIVELTSEEMTFLYSDSGITYLMHPTTFEQYEVASELLGPKLKFVNENESITVQRYEDSILGLKMPVKRVCTVAETDPATKQEVTGSQLLKPATLTNGMKVEVPVNVGVGDEIIVNTDLGLYVERHSKA